MGEEASGRKQPQHEYLYWELTGQVAVRRGNWKAIRPGENRTWELYDLSRDVSETEDMAEKNPEVLAQLKAFAREAHEPVKEGTFFDREIHERDRRAKFGGKPPGKPSKRRK